MKEIAGEVEGGARLEKMRRTGEPRLAWIDSIDPRRSCGFCESWRGGWPRQKARNSFFLHDSPLLPGMAWQMAIRVGVVGRSEPVPLPSGGSTMIAVPEHQPMARGSRYRNRNLRTLNTPSTHHHGVHNYYIRSLYARHKSEN
jgi:hypothetical protein